MDRAQRLTVAFLLLTVLVSTASAQQFIIKKRRLAVTVEQNPFCPQGISVAGGSLDGHQLCVDYPLGIVDHLEPLIGSTVEIEARWTFLPDPTHKAPVAIGEVSMVGEEQISEDRLADDHIDDPSRASDVKTAMAIRPIPRSRPMIALGKSNATDRP